MIPKRMRINLVPSHQMDLKKFPVPAEKEMSHRMRRRLIEQAFFLQSIRSRLIPNLHCLVSSYI
jgi:hypothetical protein